MKHIGSSAGAGLGLLAVLVASCATTVNSTSTTGSAIIESRLRTAEAEWHGTRYLPGGTYHDGIGPVSFVRILYEELFNVVLPRTPSTIAHAGKAVAHDSLLPGDLLVFRMSSGPFHVGVYLGQGEFAHVSIEKGVTIDQVAATDGLAALVAARRILLSPLNVADADPTPPRSKPSGRPRTGW